VYNQDQDVAAEERYFWIYRMQGALPILVTMLPGLARLVHTAREIFCDFTFKRVSGESNEWEVAIFDRNLARHIYRLALNTIC
jgi:hypothetical protein